MSIYTRTGDRGETSLFGGKRVPKSNEIVDAYGAVDELNSALGVIGSLLSTADVQTFLRTIQSDLFTIGGALAGDNAELTTVLSRVKDMEVRIDEMEKVLPKLHRFILPGGSELASYTHVARSICRRAERKIVYLTVHPVDTVIVKEQTLTHTIQYLNRLSDFLFVLARFCNHLEQKTEILVISS